MNRVVICGAVSSLFALCSPAFSATDSWKIDPSHSATQFSVRHMAISNVRGEFSGVSGVVQLDQKNLGATKVDATIDVKTISTRDNGRDEHLKGADFFDVAKYPTATFKSKKVVDLGKDKFKLVGDFTLHGVTKEVTLDVDGPSPEIKDGKGNVRVGASATTKINRKDFGINYGGNMPGGGLMIGEEIPITIDLEIVKEKSSG